LATAAACLAELDHLAHARGPQHVDDPATAVNVSTFERRPFLGPQTSCRREDRQRRVGRVKFQRYGVKLSPRVDPNAARRRLPVAPGEYGGIAGDIAPASRCAKTLA
jgi:hypothetical protein